MNVIAGVGAAIRAPLKIDPSILFLAGIIFFAFGGTGESAPFAAIVVFVLALSIYLHEIGHATACVMQGVRVHKVVLHGGGGFCLHDPAPPAKDIRIVAAGPLVNLAIWGAATLATDTVVEWEFGAWFRGETDVEPAGYASVAIEYLANVNLLLFALNLFPVMPLDGGRLTFLALWWRFPRERAVRLSGLIGTIFAVLWIPVMIALFLFVGVILFFFPSIPYHWRRWRSGLE